MSVSPPSLTELWSAIAFHAANIQRSSGVTHIYLSHFCIPINTCSLNTRRGSFKLWTVHIWHTVCSLIGLLCKINVCSVHVLCNHACCHFGVHALKAYDSWFVCVRLSVQTDTHKNFIPDFPVDQPACSFLQRNYMYAVNKLFFWTDFSLVSHWSHSHTTQKFWDTSRLFTCHFTTRSSQNNLCIITGLRPAHLWCACLSHCSLCYNRWSGHLCCSLILAARQLLVYYIFHRCIKNIGGSSTLSNVQVDDEILVNPLIKNDFFRHRPTLTQLPGKIHI